MDRRSLTHVSVSHTGISYSSYFNSSTTVYMSENQRKSSPHFTNGDLCVTYSYVFSYFDAVKPRTAFKKAVKKDEKLAKSLSAE